MAWPVRWGSREGRDQESVGWWKPREEEAKCVKWCSEVITFSVKKLLNSAIRRSLMTENRRAVSWWRWERSSWEGRMAGAILELARTRHFAFFVCKCTPSLPCDSISYDPQKMASLRTSRILFSWYIPLSLISYHGFKCLLHVDDIQILIPVWSSPQQRRSWQFPVDVPQATHSPCLLPTHLILQLWARVCFLSRFLIMALITHFQTNLAHYTLVYQTSSFLSS